MADSLLNRQLGKIHGLGPQTALRLESLGVRSCLDLARYFPRAYEDLTLLTPIGHLKEGVKTVVKAEVLQIASFRTPRRRMHIVEALLQDETGQIKAIWFNQPYVASQLKQHSTYFFATAPKPMDGVLSLIHPSIEDTERATLHSLKIVPTYPETKGVTSRMLRHFINQLMPDIKTLSDYLPTELVKKHKLMPLSQALAQIHSPENDAKLHLAQHRLAIDELISVQMAIHRVKLTSQHLLAPVIAPDIELIKRFLPQLPFELTARQKQSAWEIIQDMNHSQPMQRLLEGDVGSGKTIVAGLATLQAIADHKQVALMAPTEILAKQHFMKFTEYWANLGFKTALLTGSFAMTSQNGHAGKSSKTELKAELKAGTIDMIVGTHALIQEGVKFHELGLAIIDEQHRFGVTQRSDLVNKGHVPHLLSLTATPIPRSLALTVYGQLKISALTELPFGRQPITTKILKEEEREEAYKIIDKEVADGHQAFILTPLVENGVNPDKRSVTEEFSKVRRHFKSRRVGLIHGRLSGAEKTEVMEDFADGKVDILVATTVIEVGIDVPNATVILIENPENFGLAQLHQLRGRIGRGKHKSICILIPGPELTAEANERLEFFARNLDGFKLAEYDLKQRGPGNFFAMRQAGYGGLKIANLFDVATLKKSLTIAEELIATHPDILNNYYIVSQMPDEVTPHQE